MARFEYVKDPSDARVNMVLDIYHEAFPECERQSDEVIIERITCGFYELIIRSVKGIVGGFVLLHMLNEEMAIVDYIAISSKQRGSGIGSELMEFILSRGPMVVVEVEEPKNEDQEDVKARRVSWYRRCGFGVLKDVPYKLSSFVSDAVLPMWLMIAPVPPEKMIDGPCVRELVTHLRSDLYGALEGDVLTESILSDIPDVVRIG